MAVVTSEEAQAIVLRRLNKDRTGDPGELAVVQSCELSARGDYWIVRSNTADFVLRGMWEKCRVGLNAVLVSTVTGNTEPVGSGRSVESYLQDKYDVEAAGDRHYLLGPAFGRHEKSSLINVRQKLDCRLQEAILLMSAPQNAWLTGRLGSLETAQALLGQHGIDVTIWLGADIASAIEIEDNIWFWNGLKREMHRLIHLLAHRPAAA